MIDYIYIYILSICCLGFQDSILLEAVKFIYLGTRFNMKVGKFMFKKTGKEICSWSRTFNQV